jgi:hypothetical protein
VLSTGLITGAIRSAVAFLPIAWRRGWLAMLLAGLVLGQAVHAGGGSGVAWTLAASFALLVAAGGLWRVALGDGRPGFGGVQVGKVEIRLAAAAVLSVVFMMVLGLLAFIVLLAFAYAAAASGHGFVASDIATWARAVDDRGRVVLAIVALVCGLGLLWALGRICLAAPASVGRGRVQVLATWPMTKGRVWPIVVAWLAVLAAPTALIIGLLRIREPASWGLSLAENGAAALAATGLWLPLNVGLMTYLYSRLDSGGSRTQSP